MKEKLFTITKKDLAIDYFSGTGAGGQHRNKHQNCVRIRHTASGATATGQCSKERKANVRQALESLVQDPKFKLWQAARLQEISSGESIEEKVDKSMIRKNLKVEGKDEDGRWVEI